MPSEMQGLELSANNKPNGPFPLQSEGRGVSDFQKEFQFLIHLTTEQFSTLPQSILRPREEKGFFLYIVHTWLLL